MKRFASIYNPIRLTLLLTLACLLIPFFPSLEKHLVFLSCGSILNEIIPARENIIESSQHTPISRMKVVDSLLTDHSG